MEEHLAQMTIKSRFLSRQVSNIIPSCNHGIPLCARVMGFLSFFPLMLFVPAWLCYVFMCVPVGSCILVWQGEEPHQQDAQDVSHESGLTKQIQFSSDRFSSPLLHASSSDSSARPVAQPGKFSMSLWLIGPFFQITGMSCGQTKWAPSSSRAIWM